MNNPITEKHHGIHNTTFLFLQHRISPTGTGWYTLSGTSISSTVTTPVAGSTGVQVCNVWLDRDGSLSSAGTQGSSTTGSFEITAYTTCRWNWITQYYLTVSSSYATPSGAGWYNSGATAYAGISSWNSLAELGFNTSFPLGVLQVQNYAQSFQE